MTFDFLHILGTTKSAYDIYSDAKTVYDVSKILYGMANSDLNTQTDYIRQLTINDVSSAFNKIDKKEQSVQEYMEKGFTKEQAEFFANNDMHNALENRQQRKQEYMEKGFTEEQAEFFANNDMHNALENSAKVIGPDNNIPIGKGTVVAGVNATDRTKEQRKQEYMKQGLTEKQAKGMAEIDLKLENLEKELAQDSPVSYKYGKWETTEKSKEAFESYVNTVIGDNAEKFKAENFKADDKINYEKKVSLNVYPVSKTNVSVGIYGDSKNKRLKYILGEDESGMLYKTFSQLNGVVFPYTPTINFKYDVNYETTEILHSNLSVKHYRNSPPPNITLQAEFTADGEDNARYMYNVIQFFRALTKCEFGSHSNRGENKDYRGFPPPVLYLNGYGNFMINMPVVIKSFDVNLEKKKHYVLLSPENVWLPTDILMNIGLEIQPNLNVYKNVFDLNEYKKNVMINSNNDSKYNNIYIVNENIYGIADKTRKVTITKGNETSENIEYGKFGVKSDEVTLQNGHIGMGWTW